MLKNKRKRVRFLSHGSDRPPTPTTANAEISRNQGSPVAIEAANENLQAPKRMPSPSLSQMIEQRTWENGQLRQELMYQQRKHGASMYFLEEVKLAVESLQQALVNFQKLNTQIENESEEAS
jgi:hypothetical protein